jgi:RNA polymerase sigma-70 factor (ECF subfamily)
MRQADLSSGRAEAYAYLADGRVSGRSSPADGDVSGRSSPADGDVSGRSSPADGDVSGDETIDRSSEVRSRPEARLRAMVDEHFDFIWRSLRRLGVTEEAVDDAAQRVFLVAATHVEAIEIGRERSYLFGSAMRVAADFRRVRARVREVADVEELDLASHPCPPPDELLDQKRARQILDALLEEMPIELRTVLVLVEGEGLTAAETAELLAIPEGTVNSRLRRAREALEKSVLRFRKRTSRMGSPI